MLLEGAQDAGEMQSRCVSAAREADQTAFLRLRCKEDTALAWQACDQLLSSSESQRHNLTLSTLALPSSPSLASHPPAKALLPHATLSAALLLAAP